MNRHNPRWAIHATIDRAELTPRAEEYAIYCRDDGADHEVRDRGRHGLHVLARDRAFAGVVVTDLGNARCPRCQYKLDWRP